jgi:hypothetical protein
MTMRMRPAGRLDLHRVPGARMLRGVVGTGAQTGGQLLYVPETLENLEIALR